MGSSKCSRPYKTSKASVAVVERAPHQLVFNVLRSNSIQFWDTLVAHYFLTRGGRVSLLLLEADFATCCSRISLHRRRRTLEFELEKQRTPGRTSEIKKKEAGLGRLKEGLRENICPHDICRP